MNKFFPLNISIFVLFASSCVQDGNTAASPIKINSANNNEVSLHDTILPCDAALWEHVYHRSRLVVIEKCKKVTGVIYNMRKEKDGDWHIQLKLDAGQENLLNEKNITRQKGCLVIEPVCVNKVTQEDAISSCEVFANHVLIPKKGKHVSVVGSYVLDKQHGWKEIHPITSIEIIN